MLEGRQQWLTRPRRASDSVGCSAGIEPAFTHHSFKCTHEQTMTCVMQQEGRHLQNFIEDHFVRRWIGGLKFALRYGLCSGLHRLLHSRCCFA